MPHRHCVFSVTSLLSGLSFLAAVLGLAAAAQAYSTGPLDGLTGAPGEGNCTECHSSFPLDSGSGDYMETCNTGVYAPGDVYTICLTLSDPVAARWGFEITMVDAAGDPAGSLSPLDANVQISTGGPFDRIYAKHTQVGTNAGHTGSNSWQIRWQAPPVGTGPVTLYGMGNAANNNNNNFGDHIYSLVLGLEEGVSTAAETPALFATLQPAYPNPFNPKTTLAFTLASGAEVELAIVDSQGRRVRILQEGYLGAGEHRRIWDGRDDAGRAGASGVYLARLLAADGAALVEGRKLVLTK
jgi:hypothetical protein